MRLTRSASFLLLGAGPKPAVCNLDIRGRCSVADANT
jgi:hypothetical protein